MTVYPNENILPILICIVYYFLVAYIWYTYIVGCKRYSCKKYMPRRIHTVVYWSILLISYWVTLLTSGQSYDWPGVSEATLKNTGNVFHGSTQHWQHNHNKTKHNTVVCIFCGICHRLQRPSKNVILTKFQSLAALEVLEQPVAKAFDFSDYEFVALIMAQWHQICESTATAPRQHRDSTATKQIQQYNSIALSCSKQ